MNREQKEALVKELASELSEAEAIFAVDYRGITVPQAAELREQLRGAETSFRVVKNRLTLRAADAAGAEPLKDWLEGPTALALVNGDAALAAKTISKLGSEFEVLDYKGGLMEGEVLEADQFTAIAKLPGREQMNAQFAGIVASPLTGLVRGLGSMVQGLALQLQAIADQGLVSGEAPAEEAEAPAEEGKTSEDEAPAEAEEEEKPAEEEQKPEEEEEKPAEEEAPAAEVAEEEAPAAEAEEEKPAEEEAPAEPEAEAPAEDAPAEEPEEEKTEQEKPDEPKEDE